MHSCTPISPLRSCHHWPSARCGGDDGRREASPWSRARQACPCRPPACAGPSCACSSWPCARCLAIGSCQTADRCVVSPVVQPRDPAAAAAAGETTTGLTSRNHLRPLRTSERPSFALLSLCQRYFRPRCAVDPRLVRMLIVDGSQALNSQDSDTNQDIT